jgi:cystathionine gamma-lyase
VAAKDAGYAVTMIDMLDFNGVVAAIRPETKMIWIETPTNPTLRITDIQTISQAIKSIRKDVWIVVDNTFMTAINQLPLTLGADIVVHSVTKYLNGHCDVVMGIAVTNDPAIAKRLKFMQNAIGAVPSPFDCWLALRGMKTLALRMRAHNQNALKVAQFLESHSKIAQVKYPGLPSHPQHQIALKQHIQGHGGMIAFQLKSNNLQDSITLTQSTQIFTLAESLGGIESLIEVPAIMTHASVPAEQLNLLGISNGFIRISCGIEDVQDLIDDLSQALNSIQ